MIEDMFIYIAVHHMYVYIIRLYLFTCGQRLHTRDCTVSFISFIPVFIMAYDFLIILVGVGQRENVVKFSGNV